MAGNKGAEWRRPRTRESHISLPRIVWFSIWMTLQRIRTNLVYTEFV